VVIAATDVGSDDRAALDHMPMIEVELAGATRLRIPASTPPKLAAAAAPMIPIRSGVRL
jgi:hypothetical protein